MTHYRALSLAAASLADTKRLVDQHPEKFGAEFRKEIHDARDIILHLRGPEQNTQNVSHGTSVPEGQPTIAQRFNAGSAAPQTQVL